MPSRTRVLMVPSGSSSRWAISDWESPSKKASSIAWRWGGERVSSAACTCRLRSVVS
jgi:hypothetical protein